MKATLLNALCCLACANHTAVAQDSDVSGRVADSQRRPLAGVRVMGIHHYGGGYSTDRVQTDVDGHYNLTTVDPLLFFRKNGLRPFTLKRATGQGWADATMSAEDSGWKVPHCTNSQLLEHNRYGHTLAFLAPKSAEAKQGKSDVDNWKVVLSFPADRKEKMMIWSGPLQGAGPGYIPAEQWYLDGSTVSERTDDQYETMDVRGAMPNGRRWRSVSWLTDIVSYHDVSDEAARYFDAIIDTGCLRVH